MSKCEIDYQNAGVGSLKGVKIAVCGMFPFILQK